MTARWPVGTIARITGKAGDEVTAVQAVDGCWQATTSDSERVWIHSPEYVTVLRPLVVLDVRDPDAAVRALSPSGDAQSHDVVCDWVAREIEGQTRPRSPEPTGLGAVVEDAEGWRWVRSRAGNRRWTRPDWGLAVAYAEIPAPVRVLSEGVS